MLFNYCHYYYETYIALIREIDCILNFLSITKSFPFLYTIKKSNNIDNDINIDT